jgi:hypothetical protein
LRKRESRPDTRCRRIRRGVAADPAGEPIEVPAAPTNPIDLAVSRGTLAIGHPELPYVPGCETVGRTATGKIVRLLGGSLGRTSNAAIAESAAVGGSSVVDVPEGADATLATGLGIGADATLRLDEAGDLVSALTEAFGGQGPSFSACWCTPLRATCSPSSTASWFMAETRGTFNSKWSQYRSRLLPMLGGARSRVPGQSMVIVP